MTAIGYIFLDTARDSLIPLAEQQEQLQIYATGLGLSCDEILIEQNFSLATILLERTEGRHLVENIQNGDVVITMRAEWVLGNPGNALQLLDVFKAKGASFYCVDLAGDIVNQTERKLAVSEGIAPMVRTLCEALSVTFESSSHSAAIRAGKAKQKKNGKYLGGPVPFGFRVASDGCLKRDGKQQIIIEEMIALKNDRWSYRDIAQKMKVQHGLKFSHEGVRRILLKSSR